MICTPKLDALGGANFLCQKKYSSEFKIRVIMDMREHRLSYNETARKYGMIAKSKGGATNTLG